MTCRVVDQQEVIPKYLNGQLDPAAEDDFEVHILECPECQDAVELFQRVREQLEARAHEIRSYRVATRSLWTWVAVAGCCVIAVVIGIAQMRMRPHKGLQRVQNQTQKATPKVEAADTGSSPSAPVARRAEGPGPGSPQIASDVPVGVSASPGKSGLTTMPTQIREGTSSQANAGPLGPKIQVSSGPEKNVQSANPNEVSTAGTPEQNPVATADSPGNLTPEKSKAGNPRTDTSGISRGEPLGDKIAQLSAVRPLPYSFSGLAASQPKGGGSTRETRSSTSAVSGTAGVPQSGTSGFSTAQDYFRDGMTAYVGRRYEIAADLLGQAVRLDPEFADANLYLGICDLLQGNASGAISPLQSAARQKKPAITQAAHFYLAKAYLKLGRSADAEAELHSALMQPGRLAGEANALIQQLQALQHADANQ